jgi:hypothetical protein
LIPLVEQVAIAQVDENRRGGGSFDHKPAEAVIRSEAILVKIWWAS